jgi:hypothetical protein
LKTTDRREAKQRVESVKSDQEFAAPRRNDASVAAAPQPLTYELIAEMASEWAGQILRGDEAVRIQGFNDADRPAESDQMEHVLREAVSRGKLIAFEVERALISRGITVPRNDTQDY